jgi:hypothetical protein
VGTVNPRARGVANLRTQNAADRKDREQLRRLVSRQRSVAPASGGVTGIARASCWSALLDPQSTFVNVSPTELEIETLSGDDQGVTLTAADGYGRSDLSIEMAGYYLVKMDAWLAFAGGSSADFVEFYIDHTGSDYHFPRLRVPVTPDFLGGTSGPDAVASWTVAALELPDGGTISFGARFIPTGSTLTVNYWSVDVSRVG